MSQLRFVGLTLFSGGFLASAFVSVRQVDSAGLEWWTIDWPWYAATFLVGLVGVVILRRTDKAASQYSEKIDGDLQVIGRSLAEAIAKIDGIRAGRESTGVYSVHQMIDAEVVEAIFAFVDARESIAHRFGLQPYAEIMTRFALGERNINRAWSASADGYVDEVWICLERAQRLLIEAQDLFVRLISPERPQ
jgi:hypothetical protein